jgi:hypothetical protein
VQNGLSFKGQTVLFLACFGENSPKTAFMCLELKAEDGGLIHQNA